MLTESEVLDCCEKWRRAKTLRPLLAAYNGADVNDLAQLAVIYVWQGVREKGVQFEDEEKVRVACEHKFAYEKTDRLRGKDHQGKYRPRTRHALLIDEAKSGMRLETLLRLVGSLTRQNWRDVRHFKRLSGRTALTDLPRTIYFWVLNSGGELRTDAEPVPVDLDRGIRSPRQQFATLADVWVARSAEKAAELTGAWIATVESNSVEAIRPGDVLRFVGYPRADESLDERMSPNSDEDVVLWEPTAPADDSQPEGLARKELLQALIAGAFAALSSRDQALLTLTYKKAISHGLWQPSSATVAAVGLPGLETKGRVDQAAFHVMRRFLKIADELSRKPPKGAEPLTPRLSLVRQFPVHLQPFLGDCLRDAGGSDDVLDPFGQVLLALRFGDTPYPPLSLDAIAGFAHLSPKAADAAIVDAVARLGRNALIRHRRAGLKAQSEGSRNVESI